MSNIKIIIAIVLFVIVGLFDLGFNALAVFIPSLGAIAETISEAFLELLQLMIVLFIAFVGGKR